MSKAIIRVAAGILVQGDLVLVAERQQGQHGASLWEFPGGKIEGAESAEQALARELKEELGIQVEQVAPALSLTYDYPERKISLAFFVVSAWKGKPAGLEGQQLRWCEIQALDDVAFLPANQPVVDWLQKKQLTDT